MADTKQALGKIMDTVVASSNAVCDTIGVIGKSATYASKFMDATLAKQELSLKTDIAMFKHIHVEQRAIELTEARKQIKKYIGDNKELEALYQQSLDQLKAAVTTA